MTDAIQEPSELGNRDPPRQPAADRERFPGEQVTSLAGYECRFEYVLAFEINRHGVMRNHAGDSGGERPMHLIERQAVG